MYLRVAVEIIAALFAVFGLYSAVHLVMQKIFGSDNIVLTVEVRNITDVEALEALVREALGNFLSIGSGRVALLVATELWGNEEIERVADVYGVECYVVEEE